MSERKISKMSLEELKLYEQQLTEELTNVKFYLRQYVSRGKHTNLEKQILFSKENGKETT